MPDADHHVLQKIGTQGVPNGERQVAYLIGICGSGMKALAEVLVDRGWKVTGSDWTSNSPAGETLRRRGITLFPTHAAEQIPPETRLLVYSSAVPPTNPERRWAVEHGVRHLAYHEMLGELMRDRIGISIAGTHGKSTTTALTGTLLTTAGQQPTVLVGAEVCGRNANGWSGAGQHLIAESCEYQRHFLSLQPRLAAVLGIEEDHFDCFQNLPETIAAFRDFAGQVPADGLLLYHRECAASQQAFQGLPARCELFSLMPDTDWQAAEIVKIPLGHRFHIRYRGQELCSASLRIPGRHHVLNALVAAALAYHAGASPLEIAAGIEQFRGIRRRFESLPDWHGATVIDDYAHHPTALKATLQTAREEFGTRRLICVFQPHQVSRTLALLPEFARSFSAADEVHIVPVYGAREVFQQELYDVSRKLAEMIAAQGVAARFHASLDQTRASLDDTLRSGDVLLTLGAGDIDRIHHALNN